MRTPEEIRKAVLAEDYPNPYERHDDEMVRLAVREAVEEAIHVGDKAGMSVEAGNAIVEHFKDWLG